MCSEFKNLGSWLEAVTSSKLNIVFITTASLVEKVHCKGPLEEMCPFIAFIHQRIQRYMVHHHHQDVPVGTPAGCLLLGGTLQSVKVAFFFLMTVHVGTLHAWPCDEAGRALSLSSYKNKTTTKQKAPRKVLSLAVASGCSPFHAVYVSGQGRNVT